MIANYFKIILVMSLINVGCSAQKNILISHIESSGNSISVQDSILHKLQTENDLIIAYAVENFAWVKSMDYHIIVQKGNVWKGYKYHRNLMMNNAGSPTSVTLEKVDKAACDSILNYITEKKVWNIKGDAEDGFCADGNQNCNINDAASLRLCIITKNALINPSYYAPDFFEKCCPDEQRGLFLSITKKIASAFGESEQ
ncbi:MAG: hypothetical protein ABJB05_01745 [Parafilimonas sp.]